MSISMLTQYNGLTYLKNCGLISEAIDSPPVYKCTNIIALVYAQLVD
ncbi:hypothetical protein EV194_11424 [Natronoflexus pectinivorans]|uniref:Uncharacterized protein n=1 Tax=Natronoflexus pectinivorans TaxID=682526 RepID=A0A4V2RVY1_9BACT|nr:hypothetical protein EV194_11424 [Natronoflexus pectinivorans]